MEKDYIYNFKLDDLVMILKNLNFLLKSNKNSHRKTSINCILKYLKIIKEVNKYLIFLKLRDLLLRKITT